MSRAVWASSAAHRLKQPVVVGLAVVLVGCSTAIPKIPAVLNGPQGRMEVTVDSVSAQALAESYFRERAVPAEPLPGREALALLSRKQSVDYAALAFARHLRTDARNAAFRKRLAREVERLRTNPHAETSPPDYLLLFVPGWLYRSDPSTGADFAQPRALLANLGYRVGLVETEDNGTVEQNAAIIVRRVIDDSRSGRPIVLVSASKGGAEAALALHLLDAAGHAGTVKAWVNVGGLLNGSPLADQMLQCPRRWLLEAVFWFKGLDPASVKSMSTAQSRPRFAALRLPRHVLVVNYLGVPVSGSVTPLAADGYARLRDLGPNDGLTLLPDAIVPAGITVAELGADHFLRNPDVHLMTAALARAVIDAASGKASAREQPGRATKLLGQRQHVPLIRPGAAGEHVPIGALHGRRAAPVNDPHRPATSRRVAI